MFCSLTCTKSVAWSAREKRMSQMMIFSTVSCLLQCRSSPSSDTEENREEENMERVEFLSIRADRLTPPRGFIFSPSSGLEAEETSLTSLTLCCCSDSRLKCKVLIYGLSPTFSSALNHIFLPKRHPCIRSFIDPGISLGRILLPVENFTS